MRLLAEESIGLIIDMQERLFPHIHNFQKLEDNTRRLIQGLNALKLPLLVTQQYTKGLGPTVSGLSSELDGILHIEKLCFSCADDKPFMESLNGQKKKNVIIAGIESHICVMQTALDLKATGFNPVVVANCVGSRFSQDMEFAFIRMRQESIILTTYEAILMELTRHSNVPVFKAISKIIK